MEQDIAAQVVGLGGATDFSLWKLFLRADFVVKFVIILLIAASIFSWALIFDKFKLFKQINKSALIPLNSMQTHVAATHTRISSCTYVLHCSCANTTPLKQNNVKTTFGIHHKQ